MDGGLFAVHHHDEGKIAVSFVFCCIRLSRGTNCARASALKCQNLEHRVEFIGRPRVIITRLKTECQHLGTDTFRLSFHIFVAQNLFFYTWRHPGPILIEFVKIWVP